MNRTVTSTSTPGTLASALNTVIEALPENARLIQTRKGQTLYLTESPDSPYVIKQYTLNKLSSRLVAALRHSRAERSLKYGELFLSHHLPTPAPHLVKITGSVLPASAYLATDFFPGIQMPEYIQQNPGSMETLAQKVADLFVKMTRLKLTHGDFHAKNILVDAQENITLIDLDGVRHHRLPHRFHRRYQRDRERMISSIRRFGSPSMSEIISNLIPATPSRNP